jgi:hypothetical protein
MAAPDWQASLSPHPVKVVEACQSGREPKLRSSAFKLTYWHIPEQCLRFAINRAAQNGSRTSLKMLTLLRCVASLPFGDAVGFLVLGVHV